MSEISAAIGRIQLHHVDEWIEDKRRIAGIYRKELPPQVVVPVEHSDRVHTYHQYVIQVKDAVERDMLRTFLSSKGIETGIHYPYAVHEMPMFTHEWEGKLPVTEKLVQRIVSIPIYPFMPQEAVKYVCDSITEFYELRQ